MSQPEPAAPKASDHQTGPSDRPQHNCVAAGQLSGGAFYGAPGVGQSFQCDICQRGWAKVNGTFYPAEWGVHILTLEDCE